ncbi:4-hydroxythreonine-4-phosphate dehydrogenase PdxA [Halioxenophilus aromaticivorans]|uniref:4-hydroxythreonine-4-phosphate dehydrogenase n=1 Tax=Halioxenophilus aromaticivorans TaxID=1306992 RepID=A0AAV3U9B5_9ALTE
MSKRDSSNNRPWLAITPGEPAGIGPDLIADLPLAQDEAEASPSACANLVVIGNAELIQQRCQTLGRAITLVPFDPEDPQPHLPGHVQVWDQPLAAAVSPGVTNPENASYVINCLDRAIEGCQSGLFDGLITGPVHKGVINQAGMAFTGHTEYLAQQTDTEQVVMMLATEGLRVALATTHLPLRDVPDAITQASLSKTLTIVDAELRRKFGIQQPRIKVCGLNPHAGEGGYLGREEIDVIIPVLEHLNAQGLNLDGPLPADTTFTPNHLPEADAVVAMYHDQGLPVLKHIGFHRAVNITLGLPIIRTSVDHGTALNIAGSGQAHPGGLFEAIRQAVAMARTCAK